MKQFKLVAMSICSVVLLWMLFSGPAYSQTSIKGSVENDGQDYVGRIIVINDNSSDGATHCGDPFLDYNAVITNPGVGSAIKTTVGIAPSFAANPGDRFDIISQRACNGSLELTLLKK